MLFTAACDIFRCAGVIRALDHDNLLPPLRDFPYSARSESGVSTTLSKFPNRTSYIGSSEAAAAAGIPGFVSPLTGEPMNRVLLWMIKTGQAKEPEIDSLSTRLGTELEGFILRHWQSRDASRKGLWINDPSAPKVTTHETIGYLKCHLDGICIPLQTIVEAKCVGDFREWGPPGTDQVPAVYLLQAYHQLLCTPVATKVCIAAMCPAQRCYREYWITRDNNVLAGLLKRLDEFWKHVEDKTEPPALNESEEELLTSLKFTRLQESRSRPLDQAGRELLNTYVEHMLVARKAEGIAKDAKHALLSGMIHLAVDKLTDGNKVAVSYLKQFRKTIDYKSVVDDLTSVYNILPEHSKEIHEMHTKVGEFRVFRVPALRSTPKEENE